MACILITNSEHLTRFAEACIRFSPQVALRQPDAVFIEIGKCRKLYSEDSFIARVKVLLRRFSIEGKIAISDDIPSALAIARFQCPSTDELPIEALTDFGDPFGTDETGRKSISKMIESLRRLGIETIGTLKTIPSSHIPSRFGSLGLYCRQRIEDASMLPWPHWEPPQKYIERMELLPSEYCADLEPLLFKGKEVLDRLFSRLRGRMLRADKIRISLELEKYSTVKQPIRDWAFDLITPQGSAMGFLPILRERLNWDLARSPIESFVTAMTCEALSTSIARSAQKNFFHSREERDEAIGSLFGQLEEYLGQNRVFWASLTEERFPERSWKRSRMHCEEQPDILGRYPIRPTRVFRSPIPVNVIQDRVVLKGRTFKSIKWSAVERLSLDWIDDEPARNYYRVDLEGGRALWVFSDPSHHYFAHGYFE